MRSKMNYSLPCSPGTSPPGSGRLVPYRGRCASTSAASVVAIDNKIEQAMDLVKSHLMYAVREEVEVLKEQIKELYERNSLLERENAVLKSLANNDQLNQLTGQLRRGSASSSSSSPPSPPLPQQIQHGLVANANALLAHQGGGQSIPHQHNMTSA
ncbi:unnamed protein product [Ophioblennius macclurei]